MSDIIEIDINTNEITEREYTQEEIDYRAYLESQITLPEPTEPQIDATKQSALNKLKALGLTEAEAKAIIGL